jgi:hypothetical protein
MFFKKTVLINISLFILALLLSSLMYAGLPIFLGDASYIDFNEANAISQGFGMSLGPNVNGDFFAYGRRPPGFPILVALLMSFGFPIMTASIIITSVAYALIPVFIFLTFKHYFSNIKALLAAFVVLLHPAFIYYSKIAAPEIVGILILSATYYLYIRLIDNQLNKSKDYIGPALLLGLILGFTIWFRYVNAIYIVLFPGLIFLFSLFYKESRKSAIISIVISISLSLYLLIRNKIYTGGFSGYPITGGKTNAFDVSLVKVLNLLTDNLFEFDVNNSAIATLFVIILLVMCLFIIIKTYSNKIHLFKVLPIALMPLAYLLFYCYIQSITRVDDVGTRYILTFYLSILMQVMFILYLLDGKVKYNSLFRVLFFMSLSTYSYASYSSGSIHRTYNDRDYSPETNSYIVENIDKGSVIFGSRYVGQVFMHSLDHRVLGLNFYSDYNKGFGRRLSTDKKELLRKILKHDIKYLIIFTGPDKNERFINRDDYGEFITSLVETQSDIVESKIELSDGIVITFKNRAYLSSILDYFDNSKPLVNKDYLMPGLKVSSPKGAFKVTDKGIIFSQGKVVKASNLLLSFNAVESVYTANIKYTLPIEPLKSIAVTLRNGDEYAHFFFNRNEIKFDELSLRLDNIDRKSDNFSMDSLTSMTIRLYPVKKDSRVTNFKINSVNIYTRK